MTTQTSAADDLDHDDIDEAPSLMLRVGAELVGTFLLVTAIITVAAFGAVGSSATVLYVAFAGGLVLAGLVAALGSVSGAHLNPAVSLGAAIAGRLAWIDLAPYVVAQIVGSIGAAALLKTVIPEGLPAALGLSDVSDVIATTANGFGDHSPIASLSSGTVTFSTTQALLIEAAATAILVAVVLGVTRRPNPIAPIAIGGALTVAILVAGQATNAAINPARATGTALFAGGWAIQQLWLFWVAPLIGALIAGLIVATFQRHPEPESDYWDDEDDEDPDADDDDNEPSPASVIVVEEIGDPLTEPITASTAEEPAADEPDEGDQRRSHLD